MASLKDIIPGGFDSSAVAPQASRDPLPAGTYDVEITGSEVKETAKKNGTGLKLEYTVISPAEFVNRKIFGFINLRHENPDAENIGQSQLSALCRAVGIGKLDDSDQLFSKIVRVRVKVRPAANGYEASNDVTAFETVGIALPAAAAAGSASQAAAAKKPWERKAA